MVRIRFLGYPQNWSIVLVLVLISVGAHGEEKPSSRTCQLPEGSLVASVMSGRHWWTYKWSESKITSLREEQNPTPIGRYLSEGYLAGEWDEEKAGVNQFLLGRDSWLNVPYMVSPDEALLASAVYTQFPNGLRPIVTNHLALIQRDASHVVYHLHFSHYIQSISWSPSGQFFAVLLAEPVYGPLSKIFHDWLEAISGQEISYYTLRIGVYDLEGAPICTQLVREKVRGVRGYLEWNSS